MRNFESIYEDGAYLRDNSDWHVQDSSWKVSKINQLLTDNQIAIDSICDVGCGSGDILIKLSKYLPQTQMVGFDISPQASDFWKGYQDLNAGLGIKFNLGDFHAINQQKFDVLLMIDVFEHVRDPFNFLELSHMHAQHFVFHIPLDLSASSVVRGTPLINVRNKAGHIHYYTKDLALAMLQDTGYEIIDWRYTGASLNSPNRSWKTHFASFARRLVYAANKDWGVRLLGGETLLVLAR